MYIGHVANCKTFPLAGPEKFQLRNCTQQQLILSKVRRSAHGHSAEYSRLHVADETFLRSKSRLVKMTHSSWKWLQFTLVTQCVTQCQLFCTDFNKNKSAILIVFSALLESMKGLVLRKAQSSALYKGKRSLPFGTAQSSAFAEGRSSARAESTTCPFDSRAGVPLLPLPDGE